MPLRYTPRKISVNPDTHRVIVIETDHNAFNSVERAQLKLAAEAGEEPETAAAAKPITAGDGGYESDEMEIDDDDAPRAPAAPVEPELPSIVEVDAIPQDDEEGESPQEFLRRVGVPLPGLPGKWASCIRLFDPVSVRHHLPI